MEKTFGSPTSNPVNARKRRTTRAYFLETRLQMMSHCAEEGDDAKIDEIIDNCSAVGPMPITQTDLDLFEAVQSATHDGGYYAVDAKRLNLILRKAVPHTMLHAHRFSMTELTIDDTGGRAIFRAR